MGGVTLSPPPPRREKAFICRMMLGLRDRNQRKSRRWMVVEH